MKNNKKWFWLTWGVILICMQIGGALGIYLIGKDEGVFDYSLLLSMFSGTLGGLILVLLFMYLRKKRKRKLPEFDERSLLLMKRYFLGALYVVLIGSGAVVVTLVFLGVETVEVGLLAVYLSILYIVVGMGALVTAKL
jgi:peptidoglycan biosynthesis protein MviN/MurJ (putative lipid II flippase)